MTWLLLMTLLAGPVQVSLEDGTTVTGHLIERSEQSLTVITFSRLEVKIPLGQVVTVEPFALTPVSARSRAPSFFWSVAPLGIAQFRNGQRTKGFALLGAQTTLLLVSLWSYSQVRVLAPNGVTTVAGDLKRAHQLQRVNLISNGLLAATVTYGALDGMWFRYGRLQVAAHPLGIRLQSTF